METVRIALTKGRIQNKAVEIFSEIGIDCSEITKNTRKLIFKDYNNNLEFVLVKSSDVVTYVENGAADMGIVGKDTLMEHEGDFYEVLDLKTGKCRFAVAGPKDLNLFEGYHQKRIATKYPNVTRKYFRARKQDVEIIKIDGSVELAPILGLSDAIVDIVETGTTLRENGLVVIEEICDISTRMIVNRASMKLKREEIGSLIDKIQGYLDGRS